MGYTHYFRQRRDLTPDEWATIQAGASAVIAHCRKERIPLAYEYTLPKLPPLLDGDVIRFNGVGDDGHETFIVTRERGTVPDWQGRLDTALGERDESVFHFCKTAAKPYDVAVTAILAGIDAVAPGAFRITSDGGPQDWAVGVAFAKEAFGRDDIDVPLRVRVKGDD